MGKDNIKILTCIVDHSSETDNLKACTNDNKYFYFTIIPKNRYRSNQYVVSS